MWVRRKYGQPTSQAILYDAYIVAIRKEPIRMGESIKVFNYNKIMGVARLSISYFLRSNYYSETDGIIKHIFKEKESIFNNCNNLIR